MDADFKSAFIAAVAGGMVAMVFAAIRVVFNRGFLSRLDAFEQHIKVLAVRDEDTERRLQIGNLKFENLVRELERSQEEVKDLRKELREFEATERHRTS